MRNENTPGGPAHTVMADATVLLEVAIDLSERTTPDDPRAVGMLLAASLGMIGSFVGDQDFEFIVGAAREIRASLRT